MIDLRILEKDILICEKHLGFLKETFELSKDFRCFVGDHFKDKKTIDAINKLSDTEIFNIHAMAIISQLEISLILKSLHFAKSDFEKIYILKHSYLIIYETFKTLNVLNKNLKSFCGENEALIRKYEELKKLLKEFKKNENIEYKVKEIRNNISGHITPNFLKYHSFLELVNIEGDIDKLIRFRFVLNKLNDFLYDISIEQNKYSKQQLR